ncbi:MAG TPA: hypothetical protein VGX03_23020, partial [Candidatus Binatia bacterium]|nr:hypothetical protein [Candidatus Binatia bacterium]
MGTPPINGGPLLDGFRRSAVHTDSIFHAGSVPLPGSTGEDLREVCRLSVWGHECPPIPRITTGFGFLPHPLPSEYFRLPHGRPTLAAARELIGLPMFRVPDLQLLWAPSLVRQAYGPPVVSI